MIDRKRKVDVEKLDDEQIEVVQDQVSAKIREITDKAVKDANKILAIYGLSCKMQIKIEESDKE